MNALQEQLLRDNLQIADGGYIALRDGHYVVCPRHSNQHVVSTAGIFQAVDAGYAVVKDRTVHVTPAGWAFCGLS